jgi:hypothetical protein
VRLYANDGGDFFFWFLNGRCYWLGVGVWDCYWAFRWLYIRDYMVVVEMK